MFATRFSSTGLTLLNTLRLWGELPARAVDAQSSDPNTVRSFILKLTWKQLYS